MVRSEIKLALSDPFVWYESYRYFGTDLERFHCHPVWQLTVVTEGCLRFDFGPRGVFPLNAGDIMFIAPETPHEGHSIAEKTHSMQLFCRYFDRNMLPEISEFFSPFQVNAVWFGHRSPEVFQELSAKILADCPSTQPFGCSWRFPLLSTFLLLGLESLRGIQETTHPPLSPELSRIFPFMLEHYQEAIGVNELADVVQLSPSRFSALFRKQTGQSPIHYLNQLRLGVAQNLLLRGVPLAEAASSSGFHSVQYFCRYFRKMTGQTPGEFRANPYSRDSLLH